MIGNYKMALLGAAAAMTYGLFAASSANAGTITVSSVSETVGSVSVYITNKTAAPITDPVLAGRIDLTTALGVLKGYCVDIFNYTAAPTTYNQSTLAGGSYDANGGAAGGATAFTTSQVNFITALLYNGALQTQDAIHTAAVQLAIWEVEYGTLTSGSYNLTSTANNFYATDTGGNSTSAISNAQTYLNDITTGLWTTPIGYIAEYLTEPGVQNQVYLGQTTNPGAPNSVPEPASIALFGAGLAGLWAFQRRRRA